MLEHQKLVLKGVSADRELFKKELIKSLTWLNEEERLKLREWTIDKFYNLHTEIIDEVLFEYDFAS